MTAIVITPATTTPITVRPAEGVPVRVVPVPVAPIQITGAGIPGPAGATIVDAEAIQNDDGTVTLLFTMTDGKAHEVRFVAGGVAPPEQARLVGEALGQAEVSGVLRAERALAGSSMAVASVSGVLDAWIALAGHVGAAGAAEGRLALSALLAGTSSGSVTAAGGLALAVELSGSVVARAQALGMLQLGADLTLQATAECRATAAGTVAVEVSLGGQIVGGSFAEGALLAAADLAGSGPGRATASGLLALARALSGSASGVALASGTIALTAPAAAFTDDFNRADQTLGTSPNWNRSGGSAGVATVRDQMVQFSGSGEPDTLYYAPDTGSTSHRAQIQNKIASGISLNGFPLVVCAIDENNFIGIRPRGTNWQVLQRVAGAFTSLNSGGTINVDDVWLAEVTNNEARFYRNGALSLGPFPVPAALRSATRTGLVVRADSRNPVLDNWQSGAL